MVYKNLPVIDLELEHKIVRVAHFAKFHKASLYSNP